MQIKECIILAGGLGTRLRSEVADLPKCMAPVAGKPFLHWVIQYLLSQKISIFIFSTGYMHEKIEAYILNEYPHLNVKFSVEEEPLGTGGALKMAMKLFTGEHVLAVNGDTIFETDNKKLLYYHIENRAACTLALKPMKNFDRYGSVETDHDGTIVSFAEKKYLKEGLVNGGVYIINRLSFEQTDLPAKFSFEKDYLEKYCGAQKMVGVEDNGYFIDIGIPEDFKRANEEFKNR